MEMFSAAGVRIAVGCAVAPPRVASFEVEAVVAAVAVADVAAVQKEVDMMDILTEQVHRQGFLLIGFGCH